MRWTELPQGGAAAPTARSSHSLTAVTDDLLCLFGGELAPRKPVEPVAHLYSLSAGAWSAPAAAGALPSARLGHAAAAVGGRVYVHAGRSEVALASALDDLHVFDAATAAWAPLARSGAAPEPRNFHVAAADDAGGAFYVFGGCSRAGRLADLWRYDARAGAWARLPDAAGAAGRGGAGFALAAGALWVIGGFTGAEAGDVHRFDLAAGAWEAVAPAGAALRPRSVFARAAHACGGVGGGVCAHSEHIFLFGGEVDPADAALGHAGAGEFAADVLRLDTARREWHAEAPGGAVPPARGWAASAATPAGLALHGGVAEGNRRLSDFWLLDVHAN
jgi:hypothetical protein